MSVELRLNQQLSLYQKEERDISKELEKLERNDADASDIESTVILMINLGKVCDN